jgi:hypothetical protein
MAFDIVFALFCAALIVLGVFVVRFARGLGQPREKKGPRAPR